MAAFDPERTMQFLLEQQARFDSRLQRGEEERRELREKVDRLTGNVDRFVRGSVRTAAHLAAGVRELSEQGRATDQRLNQVMEVVRGLAAAGRATDERLNTVINILERHLGDRNGDA